MKTLFKISLVAVAATVLGAGSASAIECPDFSSTQMKAIIGKNLDSKTQVAGVADRDIVVKGVRRAELRESGGKCFVSATLGYTAKHPAKDASGTVIYRLEILSNDDIQLCFGAGKLTGGKFGGGPVKRKLDEKRVKGVVPKPFCGFIPGKAVANPLP